MNINEIIVNITSALFGAGVGCGIVPLFLFYKSKRRKERASAIEAELSNDRQSSAEWREIAESREADNEKLNAKIDAMYAEKEQDRRELYQSEKEKHALSLELERSKIRLCNKRVCAEREPQTGY